MLDYSDILYLFFLSPGPLWISASLLNGPPWLNKNYLLTYLLSYLLTYLSNIKPKEGKPPIVNQQCVVYQFKCDLCDTDYVGYTCQQLYQRIENIRDLPSGITSEINMRGTQETHLLDSRSYGSARANLTA